MDAKVAVIIFMFTIGSQLPSFEGSCYFPQEFQGEFLMQSSVNVGNGIQYSTLNITDNSIPIWGNCHRRIGNNFILMFNYSETSCIRCLHLKLRSSNVLQVFASSQETISKCFTNEESAEANCPSEESLLARETAEILLFKTRDNLGSYTSKQYCPIDGKYYLNYKGPSTKHLTECVGFNSTVDSCPSGSTLNFRLRSCTFESYDMKFDCLGDWKGPKGETFLIFTDSRYITDQKPKYRCALYRQDRVSGKVEMALSRDSTCTTDLHNSTSGYETFVLAPKAEEPWPVDVSLEICSFPKWLYGDWEHVRVKGDTMVYKDHSSFKTYTIKCVGDLEGSDKYLVFSRTQCNEESYNCMRISNRSTNILEFQLGTNASDNKDIMLCEDENFERDCWVTQGRLEISPGTSPGMCPIMGEYTGRIPDATDLCAKLWSDCRAPELMYYQVSHCESEEVYEEREYQCLGHWREANLLYTYTQRRDVAAGTYECFVGSIITDKEIFIKEAGEHCQRNVDPLRYGMKLIKQQQLYSCIDRSTTPHHPVRTSTEKTITKYSSTYTPRRTTASQNFDAPGSKSTERSRGSSVFISQVSCVYIFLYLFIKYL